MSLKSIERQLGKWLKYKRYDYSPAPYSVDSIKTAVIFIPRLIGDAMATFPALRALQHRGVEHIIVVASKQNEGLFKPLEDEGAITLYSVPNLRERNIKATRAIAQHIVQTHGRPDLCIEATLKESHPTVVFIQTLRARNNIQMNGSGMRCYAPVSQRAFTMYAEDKSLPSCWAALMEDAGLGNVEGKFELPIPDHIMLETRNWLEQQGFSDTHRYMALNLDGSLKSKQFSLEKAEMIATMMWNQFGLPIVMVCSPDGEAKAKALADKYDFVILPTLTRSLYHSAALVANAALLFTPDTSILHIGSAFNVPTIGVYREHNGHWVPLADQQSVITTDGPIEGMTQAQVEKAIANIHL